MKLFVNLPEDNEELENRIADFHATLLMEKIKQLNINDEHKKKVLDLTLENIKKCMSS